MAAYNKYNRYSLHRTPLLKNTTSRVGTEGIIATGGAFGLLVSAHKYYLI